MSSPTEQLRFSVKFPAEFPPTVTIKPSQRQGTGDSQSHSLTPTSYAKRVQDHAKTTVTTSIYPGEHFRQLARYLARLSQAANFDDKAIRRCPTLFATLYHLDPHLKSETNPSKDLRSERDLSEAIKSLSGNIEDANFLLFLRGHPTPEWLSTVGAQFRVDPEYYRRHMDLNLSPGSTNRFTSPSLPSVTSNFVTLRITTIGKRKPVHRSKDQSIDEARKAADRQMGEFLKDSQDFNSDVGTSLVRRFSIHDHHYFTIEQDISLCCSRVNDSWTVIAWLDSGKDLDKGIKGPWTTDNSELQTLRNVTLLPIIRHYPKIAFNTHRYARPTEAQKEALEGFEQSRSVLNQNYGKDLNRALMATDSFFAIHDLFTYKAFAEVQFLNLVQDVLSRETDVAALDRRPSLENLLFHKDLLESHARSLRENIESIKSRGGPDWSRIKPVDNPEQYQIAIAHSDSLLNDYLWLLQRTEELSAICDSGMQDYNNKTVRDEMLDANKRARYMHNLTRIATFFTFVYVPLNFTTSLFGMNFTVFGTGKLHIWIWAVVTLVVISVSALAMLLFVIKRNERWRRFWPFRRHRRVVAPDEELEMGRAVDDSISRDY